VQLQPLFVFAHYDDSVFSAFHALWRTRKSALEVVVCGGVPRSDLPGDWDSKCGFRSSHAALEAREAEHRRIFSLLNIKTAALPILDDQYGGSDDAAWDNAFVALLELAREFGAASIVTHSARATHPDHLRAVELAVRVAQELNVALWTTCDRPYFDCHAQCCSKPFVEGDAESAQTTLLPASLYLFKKVLVSMYRSQKTALNAVFGKTWNRQARMRRECYCLRGQVSAKSEARTGAP
jgi:LmbE family N-acetylglucosaminyl deacetylase